MQAFATLLFLLIAWGVLAFGGVDPWAYVPIAVVSAGLGGWAILCAREAWDRSTRVAAVSLGAVAVAIAIQLVPLPRSVFVALNPAADRLLAASSVPYLVSPPAWHPLSVAPQATAIGLAVFAALGVLFLGSLLVLPSLDLPRLIGRLSFLGMAIAIVGIAVRALDPRDPPRVGWMLVYGFWHTKEAGNVFGPFINRNHFAGWMVMALPLVMGLCGALVERSSLSRHRSWGHWSRWTTTPEASQVLALLLMTLTLAASVVATGSRSGLVSLAAATAVFGRFLAVRMGTKYTRPIVVGSMIAVVGLAVAAVGVGKVLARLSMSLASSDLSFRVSGWRDTLRIISDFPVFGTGVGGYPSAMLVYQTGDRTAFFAQSHNDYLQIAADGGLLVGLPVLVCLIALVRGVYQRVTSGEDDAMTAWIRAGAVAGLAGIAVQSLVEFSLQLAGNTVLFVLVAAIALHHPGRSRRARRV